MKIKLRDYTDISIMDIEGRIDIDSSEFIETVGWLIKNNRVKILCNFENVELVDYSGLSILAISYKNVSNHNGIMKFCNVPLHIKEIFRISRLEGVFYCYESEEAALKNFDEKISEIENRPLRRQFKRLEVNVEADFRPTNMKQKADKSYSGKVLNISGAGLFIYTPQIFPVRTQFSLTITIPKELAPIEMEGMVIWVSDKNLQSHCYPGMGVKFIHVDSQKQKDLLDFIDRNITHRSET